MKIPTINQLFEAGVHFGHQVRRWHPTMEQYIYTSKNGIHIINLEKTSEKLEEASKYLHGVAKKGGKVIFVGTKKQSRDIVELEAKRCGAFYVTDRWLGGTMTNIEVIKKSIKKLVSHKNGRETGEFDKYTKKERLMIDREIEKLDKKVGGLVGMSDRPMALFVIDPRREKTAIREAKNLGVGVVSLIDTNSDVREIDYPIPGNDDAIKSVAIVVKTVADAIEEGYNEYAKILVADEKALSEKKAEKTVETKVAEKEEEKKETKKEEKKEVKETTIVIKEEKKETAKVSKTKKAEVKVVKKEVIKTKEKKEVKPKAKKATVKTTKKEKK